MSDVSDTIKDAGYVAVGLGVLAFQKAQVKRREISESLFSNTKGLESQVTEVRTNIAKLAKDLDQRVQPVRDEFDNRMDAMEVRLPVPARNIFHQAREQSRQTTTQIREKLLSSIA